MTDVSELITPGSYSEEFTIGYDAFVFDSQPFAKAFCGHLAAIWGRFAVQVTATPLAVPPERPKTPHKKAASARP